MKSGFTNRSQSRIIFCVLNWGLGHASRSVPVIHELLSQGFYVELASDGRAGGLLKSEFPELVYHEMPGYDVSYPSENMQWNIVKQFPKIVSAISSEKSWVRQLHKVNPFDILISDNRYGCRIPGVYNIMISHQIKPLTGSESTNWLASRISQRMFSKYDEVWIPDEKAMRLSGYLGDASGLSNAHCIGLLSRNLSVGTSISKKYKSVAILSGPEPQRSYLESWVRKQWSDWKEPHLIVRGVTEGSSEIRQLTDSGYEVDFLSGRAWQNAILSAEVVVGRSGYSSIMDYISWRKKCILIPTPGQYEQEYLSEHIVYPGIRFEPDFNFDLIETIQELVEEEIPEYRNMRLNQRVNELRMGL